MSEAEEVYTLAMQQTGIDDPAEALDALISSYSNSEYVDTYDEDYNTEFKIGDTVRLQSGGPLMTVKKISNQILICRWFNNNNNLQSSRFHRNEVYFENHQQQEINKLQESFIKENSFLEIDIDEDEIPF